MKVTLQEIRERTYKPVDAWWTVLLVDPLASRLVRLVAPYRWITPNVLTLFATVIGVGAMVFFAIGDRWALAAGALCFHLSFVVDCMDGKIARLNGTGTIFGQWLDFVLDRVRVFFCAIFLFGGQYLQTENVAYLWVMAVAVFLDLFRYLNGQQMAKVRRVMREQIEALRPEITPAVVETDSESESDEPVSPAPAQPAGRQSLKRRVGNTLRRNRIRTHLFSGIEYEMFVFIVGPLLGLVIPVTIAAGAALLTFELFLILKLLRACQQHPAKLAKAEAELAEWQAAQVPAPSAPAPSASVSGIPTTV
ncbi:CDP-alcohol phosphatidyltransferase family protein [Actinoplanes sp. OR16]|uniref:CDP-alcohol phosphatidyltransferase family protein n=1 Tax=Actinoplanes sp. OR16 TaxID=946334 RepID=UPI000FDAB1D9|nr:CDP-alcohol phosphatidyltransferase family protein [Actinoplanes sp. OR16]